MPNKRKFTSKKRHGVNPNAFKNTYSKKDLLTQSKILSDSSSSLNSILNQNNNYFDQFDTQTFDSNNVSSSNDINSSSSDTKKYRIARDISLNGNWSTVDHNNYTYGVVPDTELIHNNMLPYYKNKSTYGKNKEEDNIAKDRKMNLFTGADDDVYIKKTEIKPLFDPVPNGKFVYGMPNMSDFYQDRVVASKNYNGVNLFANDKVTPGIGLNANEIGTHGFHTMHRIMPKNVDELRSLNKQKVTHEGVMIEGQHGEKRYELGETFLKKPDLTRDNHGDDFLPNTAPEHAPILKPNFVMRDTSRQSQLMEYTGNPYNRALALENNVPDYMRPKYKKPSKHTYKNQKPMAKYSRNSLIYNPNQKSFYIPTTSKESILRSDYIAPTYRKNVSYSNNNTPLETTSKETLDNYNYNSVGSDNKGIVITPTMVPDVTLKEIMATSDRPLEVIQSNTSHGFALNYNPLNTTLKEVDSINKKQFIITDSKKGNVANFIVNPETTIKETRKNIDQFVLNSNLKGNHMSTYNPTEITTKETMINEYDPRLTPIQKMPYITNYQPTSTTNKETMSSINFNKNLQSNKKMGKINDINTPESTVKESTLTDNMKVLNSHKKYGTLYNYNPTATTVKESMLYSHNNNISDGKKGYVNYINTPETTNKESLENYNYNNIRNNQKLYVNNIKTPGVTSKETVNDYIYNTLKGKTSGIVNTMTAKNTTKETLDNYNYNNLSSHKNGNYINTKIAKTTNKETLENSNYTGIANKQKAYINNVTVQNTGRETLDDYNYSGISNRQKGYTNNLNLENTGRETLDNYNYASMGKSSNSTYVNNIHSLKTTNKESLLHENNNVINMSGGTKVYGKSDNFTFKSIKDTVNTERAGIVNGSQKSGRVNDIKTPETTIKETNLYERLNSVGKETKIYSDKNFLLPTTNKETTMERGITGIGSHIDRPKTNGETFIQKLADRKEAIATRYRMPTQSNVDLSTGADMINIVDVDKINTGFYLGQGNKGNVNERPDYYRLTKDQVNIDVNRFVDPVILEQLRSNPYVRKDIN